MKTLLRLAASGAALLALTACQPDSPTDAPADAALRLYVIDGGELVSEPGNYNLSESEVASTSLSLAAYLVVHPKGLLMWDTLAVADDERQPGGTGTQQTIVRLDQRERYVTLGPSMHEQLASIGYTPSDVDLLALSHYHWDHTANANLFAHATWLVHANEREEMFSTTPGGSARPQTYSALANSKTEIISEDEHDVFGDGKVILKSAPGHSPGHQVLLVDLEHTGPVVLSGDLYHYPEERSLNRLPVSEFDVGETAASRAAVEEFLQRHGAKLWIGHDLIAHRQLRKAPEYYD
jgi:glyoxylase-like metal-dependent hydrolase (beta-lactamase superfamily II)